MVWFRRKTEVQRFVHPKGFAKLWFGSVDPKTDGATPNGHPKITVVILW
jgi:hypothetical protein